MLSSLLVYTSTSSTYQFGPQALDLIFQSLQFCGIRLSAALTPLCAGLLPFAALCRMRAVLAICHAV
jgi:hypothetical protein